MTGLRRGQRLADEGCARCHRKPKTFVVRWPEGPLCSRCYHQAKWNRGHCADCGVERQLPGLDTDGAGLCRDCGSIPLDQICDRCHTEHYLHRRRLCARCSLDDLLAELFPGPSVLDPLIDRLRLAESANASLAMLNRPSHRDVLVAVHRGELECSHEMLDQQFPNYRHVGNLRGLLVLAGLLEERDSMIADFEQAAQMLIAALDNPDDEDLLRMFLRWHVLRRLQSHAAAGTLTQPVCTGARQRLRVSIEFAAWLGQSDSSLSVARQGDLDQWLAEGATTRRHVAALIRWLESTKRNPHLTMPPRSSAEGDELTQAQRLKLLARYFTDDATPIDVRVAGLFYLLLARPISHIVSLTRSDIVLVDGTSLLRQDRGVVELPGLLGELVEDQFASKRHRNSSAHDPTPGWLFPGRRPGQHLTASAMQDRLRRHGLPRLRPGRHSAVAALVAELPAALAADAANLDTKTTTRWAAQRAHDRASYPNRGS